MGYTHYWEFNGNAEALARTTLDAKAIIEASGVSICGPFGDGPPELGEGGIALNGDESLSEAYETFRIAPDSGSDFCKTRGDMPYDVVVTAILIRLHQHGGGTVRSDGTWDEWKDGRALVDRLFGDCPADPIFAEW